MKRLLFAVVLLCFSSLLFASLKAPERSTPGSVLSPYSYVQPFHAESYEKCMSAGTTTTKSMGFGNASQESSSKMDPEICSSMYWMGTNRSGVPLVEYASQGAKIVLFPSIFAGLLTCLFAIAGGLLRCMNIPFVDSVTQVFSEIVGALPRMVVIVICALLLPRELRGLLPLAILWSILSAPTAMDEAGAVAMRLGGARFVEALRAHGFGAFRIYLYHIVALNLRPVVVRQGAEVMMQVVFLELSLSYLAIVAESGSLTHSDDVRSWAELLHMGYAAVVVNEPSMHALMIGLSLIALIVVMATSLSTMARAR